MRAAETFWKSGHSNTSVDRILPPPPNLHASFGNKRALYLEALARYWDLTATREDLAEDRPSGESLILAYEAAPSTYFSGKACARGCFVIGTAVTETVGDPAIRKSIAAGLRTIDADFEARPRTARDRGELKDDPDPTALAIVASAVMDRIAICAGTPRAELRQIPRKPVSVICGCSVRAD
jgi:TetR/AcrR family transcriptional regulator, copper-responsive repressor